jgi:hypothetical protein
VYYFLLNNGMEDEWFIRLNKKLPAAYKSVPERLAEKMILG